jgi:hypothetical protein
MNRLTAATGAGLTALALSLALVGCGSDSKTTTSSSASASSTTRSSATSTTPTSTTEDSPTTSAQASGPNKTIVDYIKENNITAVDVQRGDPGAPTIDLPVPDGWEPKTGLPSAPYGAIVYSDSAVPNNPPRILAILSKLTGDVDPEEILTLAPGELKNMPGYDGGSGERDELGGYQAIQLGGNVTDGGTKSMVVQKTVVIPEADAVYVLQLNGFADESEAPILGDATNVIDTQTKITP